MRVPREFDVERRVVAWAEARGVPAVKVYRRPGFPDRVFFLPGGRPLVIEFKRPGEEPGPLQRHVHGQLRALGYEVEVHDTADGAIHALARALGTERRAEERDEVSS